MPSTGRNEPCPCGSGSKYKHCCEQKDKQPFMSRTGLIMGLAVALVLAGGVAAFFNDSSSGSDNTGSSSTAGKVWSAEHGHYHDGPSGPASVPQPRESASAAVPAESSQTTAPAPASNVPASQPPGPAPAGKVWSSEHGHWHDASSVQIQPSQQGGLTASPSTVQPRLGEPRPGMVWNEEHGHYHDIDPSAPPGADEAATTPVPRSQIPRISVGMDGVARTGSDIPPPAGPAPDGKVWSREHGHWHDAPTFPSGDFPDQDASGDSGDSSSQKSQ